MLVNPPPAHLRPHQIRTNPRRTSAREKGRNCNSATAWAFRRMAARSLNRGGKNDVAGGNYCKLTSPSSHRA
jgi:hypothetical protein